jgi:hypothetical protein
MKAIAYFLLCTGLGACLTLLVAALVDNGLTFIFLSIVCTAGISLVVWIPVWWCVGFVILSLLQELVIATVTKSPAKPKPDVDTEARILTRYIRRELERGELNQKQISDALRRNGWSDEAVRNACRAVGVQGC